MNKRISEYIKLSRSIRKKKALKARIDLYDVETQRTKRVKRTGK